MYCLLGNLGACFQYTLTCISLLLCRHYEIMHQYESPIPRMFGSTFLAHISQQIDTHWAYPPSVAEFSESSLTGRQDDTEKRL